MSTASIPTPPEILHLLQLAFGEDVGSTERTEGHVVESRRMVVSDSGDSVDMLYGELLPDGVSKSLEHLQISGGNVLELGMGTGKVAFQVFFQCPDAPKVIGVEISPARYEAAVAAARRLTVAKAVDFMSCDVDLQTISELLGASGANPVGVVRGHRLQERQTDRCLWLLQGDLCAVGCAGGPVEDSGAIFMQIRLPPSVRTKAYSNLNFAPDGCRVFMLENLAWEYELDEPSNLHPLSEGITVGDRELYATSWSPEGYPFCVFVVDRSRSPSITRETAVRAVQDLYAQAYF